MIEDSTTGIIKKHNITIHYSDEKFMRNERHINTYTQKVDAIVHTDPLPVVSIMPSTIPSNLSCEPPSMSTSIPSPLSYTATSNSLCSDTSLIPSGIQSLLQLTVPRSIQSNDSSIYTHCNPSLVTS